MRECARELKPTLPLHAVEALVRKQDGEVVALVTRAKIPPRGVGLLAPFQCCQCCRGLDGAPPPFPSPAEKKVRSSMREFRFENGLVQGVVGKVCRGVGGR